MEGFSCEIIKRPEELNMATISDTHSRILATAEAEYNLINPASTEISHQQLVIQQHSQSQNPGPFEQD
jgi:hypothetical protein